MEGCPPALLTEIRSRGIGVIADWAYHPEPGISSSTHLPIISICAVKVLPHLSGRLWLHRATHARWQRHVFLELLWIRAHHPTASAAQGEAKRSSLPITVMVSLIPVVSCSRWC